MRPPEKLIVVSGKSVLDKNFQVTEEELLEKLSGDDLEKAIAMLPTDAEREWMDAYKSTMPELFRYREKLSVCLDVEVSEMRDDLVAYEYNGKAFRLTSPRNAMAIVRALEDSESDGLLEMVKQGCVSVDGKQIKDAGKELCVEDLLMVKTVASKFFFQTATVLQSVVGRSPRG